MVGTKTSTKTVTVHRKGMFDDDPFFKDSWEEWDNAMKDVVSRWDKKTSVVTRPETRNTYRQIRSSNISSDDSQAVSCTEEDDRYKMMIDVKDFKPEDINVKVVDETVIVEGKIEQKEGNSISTQMFTRRFMLPPSVNLNLVSSALSRDGVLTINAPKKEITPGIGSRRVQITHGKGPSGASSSAPSYPAGMPTNRYVNDKRGLQHTPIGGGDNLVISKNESNFDSFIEKSQKEMEDMMRRHSVQSSTPGREVVIAPSVSSSLVQPPAGVCTTRDVSRSGNSVTEREEKKWQDAPAPGVARTNRMLNEKTEMKGADGTVLGSKNRSEQESRAEGGNEETLPDGTKRKTFTKSYETRKVYSYNSTDPKAV